MQQGQEEPPLGTARCLFSDPVGHGRVGHVFWDRAGSAGEGLGNRTQSNEWWDGIHLAGTTWSLEGMGTNNSWSLV